MSRPSRVRLLALFALLAAAGCQDYNFNPVGHCLIQPGSERVKLSDISSADVLFVVDDSGSMGGEQQKLADNFSAFISNLDLYNTARHAQGQLPIDFHVAITTTSVFDNKADSSNPVCRTDCPGADAGAAVCCKTEGTTPIAPFKTVQACSGPTDTSCAAGSCRDDCVSLLGQFACCDPTTKAPARTQDVACPADRVGTACGDLSTHYRTSGSCTLGIATLGTPYPAGDFVAAGTDPKVIHFDKSLYTCATPPCTNGQGLTVDQLKADFSADVLVGTCGSNQEQALLAARRALEKALAVPAASREWPHDNAKLVLVFVGDEDDCSSPENADLAIVMTNATPGADACVNDALLPAAEQRLTKVESFVDYFTGLGRPLGAAVIASARASGQDVCQDDTCTADICCDTACTGNAAVCTSTVCGGQGKGTRLLEASRQLKAKGADVVAGSICDPHFDTILNRIAEIVKPPSGLLLPSQPADEKIAVLRIAATNGKTRKTCSGPAPSTLTTAQARDAAYDWWFTASREQLTEEQQTPTVASKYVFINHDTHACEADPGESYSVDYLGRLPASGCTGATAADADDSCVATLGGRTGDWTCFAGAGTDGRCTAPIGGVVGTCVCGARGGSTPTPHGNCPAD